MLDASLLAPTTPATFGGDPRWLGGERGIVTRLHICGQTLGCPVRGPYVVTGAPAREGSRWLPASPGFLFPIRARVRVFRGKYLTWVPRALDQGELRFAGSVPCLADPPACRAFLATLEAEARVVYAKAPFAGPAQVL